MCEVIARAREWESLRDGCRSDMLEFVCMCVCVCVVTRNRIIGVSVSFVFTNMQNFFLSFEFLSCESIEG